MDHLTLAAATYCAIRDRIRTQDAQIDEQALADTVEGLTDLHEILGAVIRAALADQALATGLEGRIGEMQARRDGITLRPRARKPRVLPRCLHRPGADFGAGRWHYDHSRRSRLR